MPILQLLGTVEFPYVEMFNPAQWMQRAEEDSLFFSADKGAKTLFKDIARPGPVKSRRIGRHRLQENALDLRIREELPGDHVIPLLDFCWWAAYMRDSRAKDCDLGSINGWRYVFMYVQTPEGVKVMQVGYHSKYSCWDIYSRELDDEPWEVGDRIFVPLQE